MKFITFKENETIFLGVLGKDGSVFKFKEANVNFSDMHDFIVNHSSKDMQNLKDLSTKSGGININKIKLLAPINPRQDVICLGINYMDHARESYKFKNLNFDGKREYAVYFSKRVNEAIGSGDVICSHSDITSQLDYEVELGVIISKDAKNVDIKNAKDYIFGYTIINDISARDLQNRHKQFYFGKSLDFSCPMGPMIISADEIDSSNLDIKCFVNDELRQSSNTKYMIFNESFVISELSQGMKLKAGSVVSMGTPSGVGMGFNPPKFLKSGDKIRCEIQGIGVLENEIL
ncbi:fumarylacetoacetate hydrolase family protein [Campylobacter sputorum subsp. bubulus]|uniref:Fumarylacetoacetate hydrolase family protein n=1 Tax=Campylobacter sputorum subsp. sputorum TaxID=32024 RepID=A0A381DIE2_9BACT|nr:fumarylacetoacetate hydrolase family protein [Campylobacter sputorum]ASM35489.1 fumarylacetoacetate (FAA) hydrolase family protein [Campylobacter sputorum aubsp. sputorum RM3237]KAB0582775.1 fumarylacetoacetate hydrolase family protein [Campylobacter sputorum subsp. sputorum]QEL05681.1 fumarylacetoacetate hydrolase family protein [Campylobacter sputorum subsp. sputorum]SUX08316.1 fumarylacetoacetate hydrolase family protein [Campylobacter sputorum subsp. bubulus]SUX10448.1 fumarylacetoaceta